MRISLIAAVLLAAGTVYAKDEDDAPLPCTKPHPREDLCKCIAKDDTYDTKCSIIPGSETSHGLLVRSGFWQGNDIYVALKGADGWFVVARLAYEEQRRRLVRFRFGDGRDESENGESIVRFSYQITIEYLDGKEEDAQHVVECSARRGCIEEPAATIQSPTVSCTVVQLKSHFYTDDGKQRRAFVQRGDRVDVAPAPPGLSSEFVRARFKGAKKATIGLLKKSDLLCAAGAP